MSAEDDVHYVLCVDDNCARCEAEDERRTQRVRERIELARVAASDVPDEAEWIALGGLLS